MEYKVFIPSAGLGTRLNDISKNINKSLVTIYDKPSISYIIEKFPKEIEIVIALGYKGDLLKDFLEIAYPDRKITTIFIDKFIGTGSGLGYTILKCKDELQCPFIFCSNDTIVLDLYIPEPFYNWIGYDEIYDNEKYRSLKIVNGFVEDLNEKGYKIKSPAYIGLSGIYDYKKFWKIIDEGIKYGSISIGESYGLRKLSNIKPIKFTWYDTGNIEGIKNIINYFDTGEYNILRKINESIWFIGDKVIKYHHDKNFISQRIERSKKLNNFIPEIVDKRENLYSYKFIKGDVLSKCLNTTVFKDFIKKMSKFWKIKELSLKEKNIFINKCMLFYKDKTYERVNNYFVKYDYVDKEEIINGIKVPTLKKLLEEVDWDNLSQGIPVSYHGDLHFENILLSETNEFVLLDWRQNFSGIIEYGDIYYDLAKLLHGIIVSHNIVNNNHFIVEVNDNIIKIDIYRNQSYVEIESLFYKFLEKNNYNIKKVKILTALIYLNIATLHHYPYSKFLFFFGKYMLNNILNEKH